MSYDSGSNYKYPKENKNEGAYNPEEYLRLWTALNTLQGMFDAVKIVLPEKYRDYLRNEIEARYGKIEGSRTFLSNCELVFI